ncbi:hypothetical protein H9P43_009358 [Blastocladiella emersonii ATCC 22665]|nr:hypothetical protein H9P43_009358 [Blastocladiella emersonii ATCC 22665]
MEDYEIGADILGKLRAKKGSVKGLCLAPRVGNKKKVYALVCQTLKLHAALSHAIQSADLLHHERQLTLDLALVVVHDLLFARRGVMCGGWVKPAVMRHRDALRAALAEYARSRGIDTTGMGAARVAAAVAALEEQATPTLPRYVRVNTLRTTVDAVVQHFTALHAAHSPGACQYGGVLDNWHALQKGHFYRDPHLPELLVFPAGTDFHLDPLYKAGEIILQDKASAFPAFILAPPAGAHVVDACAAPGNKTSHLAAVMQGEGYVTAFDQDARRLDLLKDMTYRAGCRSVRAVHGSFLEVDPVSMPRVTHLLLDPSCSGSGIVSRLDSLVDVVLSGERNDDPDRLASLAKFQTEIVLHAMKFPAADLVSYSTCSVHAQENEHVVAAVLAANPRFELAPRDRVLPAWPHRGDTGQGLSDEDANKVVRAAPEDGTNGFFVALFQRRKAAKVETDEEFTVENGYLPTDDEPAYAGPAHDKPRFVRRRADAGDQVAVDPTSAPASADRRPPPRGPPRGPPRPSSRPVKNKEKYNRNKPGKPHTPNPAHSQKQRSSDRPATRAMKKAAAAVDPAASTGREKKKKQKRATKKMSIVSK